MRNRSLWIRLMADNQHLILEGNVNVVLMEWLPIGHETIKCLQDKLECLDTKHDFFITSSVDTARNTATICVDQAEIMLCVENYEPMEKLQFSAKVAIEETGAAHQEEQIGVTVNRDGSLSYGITLTKRDSRGPYSMDDLSYIVADLVEDSSRVMDTIFNAYQKNLLDIIYCNQRSQRDKYVILMADRFTRKITDANELFENQAYRLELQQVLGRLRGTELFTAEDGTCFIPGESGVLVLGANGRKYSEMLSLYGQMGSMAALQNNVFSRISMSWDNLYEQKQRIKNQDIEWIVDIQSELSTLSGNHSMMESIPRHLQYAVQNIGITLDRADSAEIKFEGHSFPFFRKMTGLLIDHAAEWIADGERALRTLGREVENIRSLASALSEKETFNINKVMNALTIMSAIFLPLTLITGIYGMNFWRFHEMSPSKEIAPTNMPELYWKYGYLFAFGLMLCSITVTVLWLRRIGVVGRRRSKTRSS
jgi:Mg2+ and Co2+ transporter CorA